MLPENAAHRIGDFSHRSVRLDRGQDGRQQVFPRAGAGLDFGNGFGGSCSVTARAKRPQALDLLLLDRWIDAQNRNGLLVFGAIAVHAHDDTFVLFDALLIFIGRFLDLALDVTALDRAKHAAQSVDAFDAFARARFDLVGQVLDGIGAADRIYRIGHA